MKPEGNQPLSFASYEVTGFNGQVLRRGRPLALSPKAVAVLWVLASQPRQLVSKEELFSTVWTETIVTDGVLTSCIHELRQALGDTTGKPRYIETVHRRGYRFLPSVTSQPMHGAKLKMPKAPSPALEGGPPASQAPVQAEILQFQSDPLLVGRDTELTDLHKLFAKAMRGERQIVSITGEPGIGKTTLVDAFLAGMGNCELHSDAPAPQNQKPKAQRPTSVVRSGSGLQKMCDN